MKEAFELIKERLETEIESSDKYIREYDSSQVQIAWNKGMRQCLEIVSEVEAEYINKHINKSSDCSTNWIPCSERLPENDDDVLVWYEFKVMRGTHVGERVERYGVGWFYKRTKSWLVDTTHDGDYRVIAWQPLPAPPKKEGN